MAAVNTAVWTKLKLHVRSLLISVVASSRSDLSLKDLYMEISISTYARLETVFNCERKEAFSHLQVAKLRMRGYASFLMYFLLQNIRSKSALY